MALLWSCSRTGFIWTFFLLWRIVDLPEMWGFWIFYLEFLIILPDIRQNLLYLVKNLFKFLKNLQEFWVLGKKFLSFEFFIAWVLFFSPWVFDWMSKIKACSRSHDHAKECNNLRESEEVVNSTCGDCFCWEVAPTGVDLWRWVGLVGCARFPSSSTDC